MSAEDLRGAPGSPSVLVRGLIRGVIVPVAVTFAVSISSLIAFAITDKNQTHSPKRRRSDQYEDAATQSLNHSGTRGRGLGVAKSATLSSGWNRRHQNNQSRQGDCEDCNWSPTLHKYPQHPRRAELFCPGCAIHQAVAVSPSILHP
jgi:hypothetical protein